jgi:hypothetical protein
MVKRIASTGKTTLLSKQDRVSLRSFEQAARSHVKKVTRSRKAAMKELIDAGIYGADGQLRKQYRSIA